MFMLHLKFEIVAFCFPRQFVTSHVTTQVTSIFGTINSLL